MNPNNNFNSILEHLIELRSRLVKAVLSVVIATAILLPFANDLYAWIALPLTQSLIGTDSHMIATGVASPFLTPFKLAILAGIFLAIPSILYQLWAFIAPGLYKEEKSLAFPLLLGSIALFYTGGAFAYFVVFPLVFDFLVGVAPEGVQVATDINNYLDFTIQMFFAFGIAFQVPIATIFIILSDIIEPSALSAKRPYIIVFAFVLGMLLTPPDVISQSLLALPMWLLFELGILAGKWLKKEPPQAIIGAEQARHPQERDTEDFFGENTANTTTDKDTQNEEQWHDELDDERSEDQTPRT